MSQTQVSMSTWDLLLKVSQSYLPKFIIDTDIHKFCLLNKIYFCCGLSEYGEPRNFVLLIIGFKRYGVLENLTVYDTTSDLLINHSVTDSLKFNSKKLFQAGRQGTREAQRIKRTEFCDKIKSETVHFILKTAARVCERFVGENKHRDLKCHLDRYIRPVSPRPRLTSTYRRYSEEQGQDIASE